MAIIDSTPSGIAAEKKSKQQCGKTSSRYSSFAIPPADYAHIDFLRLESNSLEIGPSATGKNPTKKVAPKCELQSLSHFPGSATRHGCCNPLTKKSVSLTENWQRVFASRLRRQEAGLGHIWSDGRANR